MTFITSLLWHTTCHEGRPDGSLGLMVPTRPRDLAPLRRELIEFGQSDLFASLTDLRAFLVKDPPDEQTRSLARSMQEACTLQDAELFHLDEAMCDLVFTASESLPEFRLELDDATSRDGFVWLSKVLLDHDMEGTPISVRALSWRTWGQTFLLSIYVERDSRGTSLDAERLKSLGFPDVYPLGAWEVPLDGGGMMTFTDHMTWRKDETQGTTGLESVATLKTFWLLMKQPLVQEVVALPNRNEKRRAAREGHREPPPVRVIQLRRPRHVGGGSGEGSREYHYQWIVRGHWRNQFYGEGRKYRRPVWIAPHIKGPEDAPLLGGEKVYTLKGESK